MKIKGDFVTHADCTISLMRVDKREVNLLFEFIHAYLHTLDKQEHGQILFFFPESCPKWKKSAKVTKFFFRA